LEYLKPNYPKDAFEGTADYYLRYRIPYPPALIDNLIENVNLSTSGVLLDLACGPGRLTIPLARSFSKVIAIDIDPGMVAVGKDDAKEQGINNIEWFIGRAEELELEPNSVDLITMGDAFHRLDQSLILDQANRWLKPGANAAIVGMYSIWRGNEEWHKLVSEIIDKWTPLPPVLNISEYRDYGLLLKDKGFTDTGTQSFEFPNHCTIDSIVGYLYSTSRCSKKILGNNASEFEAELRSELIKLNEHGVFSENIKCGYTIGKKPLY
jgi:SAM-dependent methyltransferase